MDMRNHFFMLSPHKSRHEQTHIPTSLRSRNTDPCLRVFMLIGVVCVKQKGARAGYTHTFHEFLHMCRSNHDDLTIRLYVCLMIPFFDNTPGKNCPVCTVVFEFCPLYDST